MLGGEAASPASVSGASHGALAVSLSLSSWLANGADGSHSRGGATTTDCARAGSSAAIMAVSARNCWLTAKELPGADVAEPSTSVIAESASSTFMVVPVAVGVEATALEPVPVAGITLLLSTTVLIPLMARLASTLESASPSAGHAIELDTAAGCSVRVRLPAAGDDPDGVLSSEPATDRPSWKALVRSLSSPWWVSAATSTSS